jgi:hypothetical protein
MRLTKLSVFIDLKGVLELFIEILLLIVKSFQSLHSLAGIIFLVMIKPVDS